MCFYQVRVRTEGVRMLFRTIHINGVTYFLCAITVLNHEFFTICDVD